MSAARLALLAVVALAAGACRKTSIEPPIAWHTRVAPACGAAKRLDRPLLFINWASFDVLTAELDHTTFEDQRVRQALREGWVALKVDRSDVYMNEGTGSEQEHEVEEAQRRFKPGESKYATIVLMAPDCSTEIGRLNRYYDPPAFLEQLAAAQKRLRK